MFEDDNEGNLCDGCVYIDCDCNCIPCNICIDWIDDYLVARNYKNSYAEYLEGKGNEL